MADAASRVDVPRFSRAAKDWHLCNNTFISQTRYVTHGRTSLIATPCGPAGGAVGHLAELLINGHKKGLRGEEEQVARLLSVVSTFANRLVKQQHHRLPDGPCDGRQQGSSVRLQLDPVLRGLLGASELLHFAQHAVDDPAVQMFLKGIARRLGKAKEKAEPCTLAHLKMLTNHALARPLDIEAQTVALVALIAFWGCLRLGSLIPKSADKLGRVVTTSSIQLRGTTMLLTLHHSKTIQFAERKHCIEIPAQADPLLCTGYLRSMDPALAIPYIPDTCARCH